MPEEILPNQENNLTASQELTPSTQPVVKNEKPPKNHHLLKYFLIGILFAFAVTAVIGAYFLGKSEKSENNQITETQVSAPSPTADPTADWKTYENKELGIQFEYPSYYEVISESNSSVVLGFKSISDEKLFPYLTVSRSKSIDYSKLKKCSPGQTTNTPCLDSISSGYQKEEIMKSKLDEVDSVSFITSEGPETLYYIVQTVKEPSLELKMNVAGGGLGNTFEQILSSFKFKGSTSQTLSPNPSKSTTANGSTLENIKYTLPSGWTNKLQGESLTLSPSNGGYLSIKVYDYDGKSGRREFYCETTTYCIDSSTFTPTKLGNISGYKADALDNSGEGSEYFGDKGNKFYIISTYNPPTPNDFEKNYQSVLNSLIF